jgi:hypothetical protein
MSAARRSINSRGEPQLDVPIGLRFGQAIDELIVGDPFEALQSEGWARAVAQQPLQPGAVGAFDADRSIQEKPPPRSQLAMSRLGGLEIAGAGEPAEPRARSCCCTAARSSGVSAPASVRWTCPCSPAVNTPSITQQWKWTWALGALPSAATEGHRPQALSGAPTRAPETVGRPGRPDAPPSRPCARRCTRGIPRALCTRSSGEDPGT